MQLSRPQRYSEYTISYIACNIFSHNPHYYQKSFFSFLFLLSVFSPCMIEGTLSVFKENLERQCNWVVRKDTSLKRGCWSCGQMRSCHPCKDLRKELSRQERERKQAMELEGRERWDLGGYGKEFSLLPLHHLVLSVIRQGKYWFTEKFRWNKRSIS